MIDILVAIIAPNEKTQKGLRMNKTLRTTLSTLLATVLVITLLSCAAPPAGQTTTTTAQGKKRVVEVMRGTLSENVTVEGNLEMPRYYDLTFGASDGEVKQTKRVNGTVDPEVLELRRQIEKQSNDLGSSHRTISDLRAKNSELEERIIQINKELHGAQEFAKSLECELKENVAQKEDQVWPLHIHNSKNRESQTR